MIALSSCSLPASLDPCGDAGGQASVSWSDTPCQALTARVLALCPHDDAGRAIVGQSDWRGYWVDIDDCGHVFGADPRCSSHGGGYACVSEMDPCLAEIGDAGTCHDLLAVSCGLTCYQPSP
jgi:hypothetical protein